MRPRRLMHLATLALGALLWLPTAPSVYANAPPADPLTGLQAASTTRGIPRLTGTPARDADKKSDIRPYAEVIPKDAKTEKGLFKTHRVKDKLFFEIPTQALGRELLWVTTFARIQTNTGYHGTEVQNRVVRWEKDQDDRLLLRGVDYDLRAEKGSVQQAVEASSLGPILMAFDVKAYGPDKAPVIDVTPLYTTEVAEISAKGRLSPTGSLDVKRTFVEQVRAFPRNVETSVTVTYAAPPATGSMPMFGRRTPPTVTAVLHHSMILLPETLMQPRLADSRVGYFYRTFLDFGRDEHRAVQRHFIQRWRLEKKDPKAAVSEPVKPIVYYIAREVPEKWRPYIKQGIEDWQPAFEAAGFSKAIIAKDAPTPKEDPNWDPDDIRNSVIRWLPSEIENAYGPSVVDPRSGEVLNANIKFFHNVIKLAADWYFIQASPSDPRAQKLPFSDALMGELMRYIAAHEVGHTLGLMHNMKASSAFTVPQLRDPAFTAKWGTEASIMAYGRFNYVAQPGDGARLIPKLGPYDAFAIEWGYKPCPVATTPDEEKPFLDQIAARQVTDPLLRFGHWDSDVDPLRQTENLGSDAIAATELGLRNLDRVLAYMVPAVCKPGEDYDDLTDMYVELLYQRWTELEHVVAVVGGVEETDYHYGRGGAVYKPVTAARQREAVRFLLAHCFATPTSILRADILDRITPAGFSRFVLRSQRNVLQSLLDESRARRMVEQCALHGGGYRLETMMEDVRSGIFSELATKRIDIDPYRRDLQRTYIDHLGQLLTSTRGGDLRPLARTALLRVRDAIALGMKQPCTPITMAHLRDMDAVTRRYLRGARDVGTDGRRPGWGLSNELPAEEGGQADREHPFSETEPFMTPAKPAPDERF